MIKFDAKLLAAVALAQSTETTRPSICGVYLDGHRAVATDGHALNIAYDENAIIGEPGIYPISKKAITVAKKAKATSIKIFDGWLYVCEADGKWIHMEQYAPIDATYPDYKRIIPTTLTETDEIPAFTAAVINHVTATASIVSVGKARLIKFIGSNYQGANVVRYDDHRIFSVVMPCLNTIPVTLPEWF